MHRAPEEVGTGLIYTARLMTHVAGLLSLNWFCYYFGPSHLEAVIVISVPCEASLNINGGLIGD